MRKPIIDNKHAIVSKARIVNGDGIVVASENAAYIKYITPNIEKILYRRVSNLFDFIIIEAQFTIFIRFKLEPLYDAGDEHSSTAIFAFLYIYTPELDIILTEPS